MTPRLIGGEMMVWSDLDGTHGAGPVSSPALRPLLATASGRTLVAGPHDPELLAAVPSPQLTVLVRGVPDADRFGSLPEATVLVGSIDKVAAAPTYDTIVALDGLDRLRTAEDDAAGESWADDLARLVALLRPGGRLLLGLENLFGVHRLLALPGDPADTDWATAGPYDHSRPASPAQLIAALSATGLTVSASYAAFPDVVISAGLLADGSHRGWATATIRAALDGARSTDGASADLADPGRILAGALRAGIGAELAPTWYVVAEREGSVVAERDGTLATLPVAVLPDGPVTDSATLPAGPTLDELLFGASLRRDLPGLRELLTAWQSGEAAGVPADRIVVTAGGHVPMAPAGDPLVALRRTARAMIREGHAYLWPAPADEAELTALLASLAGREAADIPALPDAEAEPADLRELRMDRDRLTQELAEARAKQRWYENMLVNREAELKRVRRINTMLMATMPGKAAKATYGRLRAGKAALRKLKG